jgi:hypothetical protein
MCSPRLHAAREGVDGAADHLTPPHNAPLSKISHLSAWGPAGPRQRMPAAPGRRPARTPVYEYRCCWGRSVVPTAPWYYMPAASDNRRSVSPSLCRPLKGSFPPASPAASSRSDWGSWDKTLKLWEVRSDQSLRTLEGHTDWVFSVCLSANGRYAIGEQGQDVEAVGGGHGPVRVDARGTRRWRALGVPECGGSADKTLKLRALDWELADRQPADWDEGARPYLESFLVQQTPYAGSLPANREPTEEEVALALTRRGRPMWTDADFQRFLFTLGCAGYGWLRPDGVRRELDKMAATWQGPVPLNSEGLV